MKNGKDKLIVGWKEQRIDFLRRILNNYDKELGERILREEELS